LVAQLQHRAHAHHHRGVTYHVAQHDPHALRAVHVRLVVHGGRVEAQEAPPAVVDVREKCAECVITRYGCVKTSKNKAQGEQ
jgi:hypothetical protein